MTEWLDDEQASLHYVEHRGEMVAYAITVRTKVKDFGDVAWVTQLVVHSDFRKQGIARKLLSTAWGFTDFQCWGLLSANPYAVRALERATRRRCDAGRIAKNAKRLLRIGSEHVKYVTEESVLLSTPSAARVNTEFYLDHASIASKLTDVTRAGVPWLLGELPEGWEWLAFTFQDQVQACFGPGELDELLAESDRVTQQAYERMVPGRKQAWMNHTEAEVRIFVESCALSSGSTVLDIGCGRGRHSIQLARQGMASMGVDCSPSLIESAAQAAVLSALPNLKFECRDCRSLELGRLFDAVLCVYDVVGSYVDDESNLQLLRACSRHVRTGGRVLLSVMILALAERIATSRFCVQKSPDVLLALKPSDTMEVTGNVFDPQFFALDDKSGVVYRKEQFSQGASAPIELLVRDRRFYLDEITRMCASADLTVVWSRFVRAGAWDKPLRADDDHAKEILLLCERRDSVEVPANAAT